MATSAQGSVGFISLGCSKNTIDSETMLGRLASQGFIVTGDYEHADIVVVNTCGFLEASRDESLSAIREVVERKADGHVKRVVVAGCMVGNYRDLLLEKVPQVDALVSVNDREDLSSVIAELKSSGELQRELRISDPDARGTVYDDRGRLRITPRHFAYLRISEGCDHTCSFCIIPQIRGKHRSKPADLVIDEAREMVADGAKELILISQDSTYYGVDIDGKKGLAALLKRLAREVEGSAYLRVMYAYPNQVTDELVDVMASESAILPYMDMPLQHVNDRVLASMRRGGNRKMIEGWIERFRNAMPDFLLRSTFIAGFPGETEAEHQELVDWIREGWIDRLGCFAYSPEKDSLSASMEGHLDEATRFDRQAAVMEAATEVLFAKNQAMVGQEAVVMIDGASEDPKFPWVARTKWDAPDVDCTVLVAPSAIMEGVDPRDQVPAGEFRRVRVKDSLGFDLLAEEIRDENRCQW
ncbi:MAG: 30S ribosomal protein S12 methylthiotransferase RimO [Planctomycetes bacterium]|nr:30S ribosomal protein S12 methylthiotransferase RimO [Planctomycetota bacterium]